MKRRATSNWSSSSSGLVKVIRDPQERQDVEGYLGWVVARLRKPGIVYRPPGDLTDPAQAILAAAGPQTLVVMAIRGQSGLIREPLGTVAKRLAHGRGSLLVDRTDGQSNGG